MAIKRGVFDPLKRIIIVDDEELMRYSLTSAFRNDTTEVVAIGDGKTAFQVLSLAAVDLCILDVHLPDMSGLTIMQHLRQETPGTKIIIMTGSEVSDEMFKAVRENAHALLSKPFELAHVKSFVSRLLTADSPLSEQESVELKESMPSIKWIADDFRKGERQPLSCHITCSTAAVREAEHVVPVAAEVLDISPSGLCLLTERNLEPGDILLFEDTPCQCKGIVRWSMCSGKDNAWRAGVQFITREGTA